MTQIELKNSNGVGSEVILENPDTNIGGGKTLDVSKLVVRDDLGYVNVKDFGAKGDGITNDTSTLLSLEAYGRVYMPSGNYLIDSNTLDYSKYYGEGIFKIGSALLPCGDIRNELTIEVPTTLGYKEIFKDYLSTRRIFKALTISIPSGSYNVDMTDGENVQYEHIDGKMINIVGAGSSTTSLIFDFTGQEANRMYALGLNGNFTLNYVNGITFNGNNYSGHSNGSPTLGIGDARDPIGLKAQNNSSIELGSDVKFTYFARNGILVNEGSYVLANGANVSNCGSDAFVASIGASLYAEDSSCSVIYGDAYFADRGGDLYCKNASVDDIRKRFDGLAGDGLTAVQGGNIYCDNATVSNVADVGILIDSGGKVIGDDITVGGIGVGCGNYGVQLKRGMFSGDRLDVSYSGNNGIQAENCSTFSSDGCVSSNNSGKGLNCVESSSATVTGGAFDNNTSDGINCSNSYVHATSLASIDNNGGFGIIARRSGVINADGTSVGTGNGSGTASPTADTSTGIADSYIYT